MKICFTETDAWTVVTESFLMSFLKLSYFVYYRFAIIFKAMYLLLNMLSLCANTCREMNIMLATAIRQLTIQQHSIVLNSYFTWLFMCKLLGFSTK